MHFLRLLGGIGLSDAHGREIDSLLRKPKHVALLAYLAMPHPGAWHRRDLLIATFWPDTDQDRARASLRSALLIIRRSLPEGAIVARGDDELSLVPATVHVDVHAMSEDFSAGRFDDALAQYQGDLLPGVFIADAPEFDRWLEQQRRRLRTMAGKAATQISAVREKRGDIEGAIDAARRAAELSPDDEPTARRWIALLDKAGDRAQAFAVYERFRNHLDDTLGVRPSAETVALLDAIRARREPVGIPPVAPDPIAPAEAPLLTDRVPATSAVKHSDSMPTRLGGSDRP
ncbi:MAG: hypothetical protein IT360_27835, partial [Gemmatimonadaceae bacterium]|nr:hypothetical protein [Gemmatimonadaceae bacterium]